MFSSILGEEFEGGVYASVIAVVGLADKCCEGAGQDEEIKKLV